MNKFLLSTVAVSLLSTLAYAGPRFEVTPYVGKMVYNPKDDRPRFDDSKVLLGAKANAYITEQTSIQLAVEASNDNPVRNGGKTDIERGMLNVQYDIPSRGNVTPYVLAGGGYERVHLNVPADNLDSQAFYNAGAGLRYSVNERVDLVAEGRVIHKVEDQDTDAIASVGLGLKFGSTTPALTMQDLAARTPQKVEPVAASKLAPAPTPAPAATPVPVETVTAMEPVAEVINTKIVYDTDTVSVCDVVNNRVTEASMSNGGSMPCCNGSTSAASTMTSGTADAGYYVQVIALGKNSPDVIEARLDAKGYPHILKNDNGLTRVLVGPYASRSAAVSALRGLKKIRRDAFIYRVR